MFLHIEITQKMKDEFKWNFIFGITSKHIQLKESRSCGGKFN